MTEQTKIMVHSSSNSSSANNGFLTRDDTSAPKNDQTAATELLLLHETVAGPSDGTVKVVITKPNRAPNNTAAGDVDSWCPKRYRVLWLLVIALSTATLTLFALLLLKQGCSDDFQDPSSKYANAAGKYNMF
jgi:hypothetical protein